MSYDVEGDSMSRWFETIIQKVTPSTTKPIVVLDSFGFLNFAEVQKQLTEQGYSLIFAEPNIQARMKYELEVKNRENTILVISGKYNLVDDIKAFSFIVELNPREIFRNFDEKAIKGLSFAELNKIDSIPIYKELSFDETVSFVSDVFQKDNAKQTEELNKNANDLLEYLPEQIKTIEDNYKDWFAIAQKLGELGYDVFELNDKEYFAKYKEVLNMINNRFQIFVSKNYELLFSLSGLKSPITIDKVQDFIAANSKNKKIAFIVIDGMNYWQWTLLKHSLEKENLNVTEKTSFSWLPSITAWARQAIFAGKKPDLTITNRNEGDLFKNYWVEKYQKQRYQVSYEAVKNNEKIKVPSSDVTVAGFVTNGLDELMHGNILGYEQLFINTQLWIEKSCICESIKDLHKAGYEVYISTDHGNIEAELNLKLTAGQKTVILSKSKRFVQFDTEEQAISFIENNKKYQLGKKDKSVYFRDTNGFGSSGEKVITHGGSHILELLIPVGVIK